MVDKFNSGGRDNKLINMKSIDIGVVHDRLKGKADF